MTVMSTGPTKAVARKPKSAAFMDGPTLVSQANGPSRVEIPPVLVETVGQATIELRLGTPPWLVQFAQDTMHQVHILAKNGAKDAALARIATLCDALEAERQCGEEEMSVEEAARLTGRCEETIRRHVRARRLPVKRNGKRGRIHIRRGDLQAIEGKGCAKYDVHADAQDIVNRRLSR
jgi:hypothetical protein